MIIELIGNINKKKFNRKNGGEIEANQLNQEIDRWKWCREWIVGDESVIGSTLTFGNYSFFYGTNC